MRFLLQRREGSVAACCCYFLLDFILVIFVGALCWLLFTGFVPPYKRGFYCNDQSIRLPFKPNTISTGLLLTVSIGVPVVLIAWYNVWQRFIPSLRRDVPTRDLAEKLRALFAVSTPTCVEYFFGLMAVVALMHFGKSAFGILRPHFIDVCRPNRSLLACDLHRHGHQRLDANGGKKLIADSPVYIYEPYCTTKDFFQLKVARESFPSGHAAVSVYALLFVVCFIQDRSHRTGSSSFDVPISSFCPALLKFTFLLICVLWTAFVCVSRVTDHWHHWTDVGGGVVLGGGVGAMLFYRRDSAIKAGASQGKTAEY